jgi:hypothetical protein
MGSYIAWPYFCIFETDYLYKELCPLRFPWVKLAKHKHTFISSSVSMHNGKLRGTITKLGCKLSARHRQSGERHTQARGKGRRKISAR